MTKEQDIWKKEDTRDDGKKKQERHERKREITSKKGMCTMAKGGKTGRIPEHKKGQHQERKGKCQKINK